MCLPCIDPLVSWWDRINPFKKARERMTKKAAEARQDKNDRDNVEIPFVLEEKRTHLTSDPGVPDHTLNGASGPSLDVVVTMKKVSSLGLV